MKYQRVLYTKKFTAELKSKLRIASYDKRRSLKGNVYYVSFASDNDAEYADRISKHLRDITMKPFQPRSAFTAQPKKRIDSFNNHPESCLSSSSMSTSTSMPLLSPLTGLAFLPDCLPTTNTSKFHSSGVVDETLEERAVRLLGSCVPTQRNTSTTSASEETNLKKQQLIDTIQSCLNAIQIARRAADELSHLHKCGANSCGALNHLLKAHLTAFYLKAAASTQIKAAVCSGVRLSWSIVANSVNALRADILHEQTFMAEAASAKHISSKIDNAASIAISSKLVYHLTKLSV